MGKLPYPMKETTYIISLFAINLSQNHYRRTLHFETMFSVYFIIIFKYSKSSFLHLFPLWKTAGPFSLQCLCNPFISIQNILYKQQSRHQNKKRALPVLTQGFEKPRVYRKVLFSGIKGRKTDLSPF